MRSAARTNLRRSRREARPSTRVTMHRTPTDTGNDRVRPRRRRTRAALLDALSRVPGVTATGNVANLDGVTGVAIGRSEPVRAGQRQEIIIDPNTGLVIGERTVAGAALFGFGLNEEMSVTAVETTVTGAAP